MQVETYFDWTFAGGNYGAGDDPEWLARLQLLALSQYTHRNFIALTFPSCPDWRSKSTTNWENFHRKQIRSVR